MIAIENVRLFDEVQARTREVSEALEQQTASERCPQCHQPGRPSELQPVLDAMRPDRGAIVLGGVFPFIVKCADDRLSPSRCQPGGSRAHQVSRAKSG